MDTGVFYIFHGEDEFSRSEYLTGLRAQVRGRDAGMAELNTSELDGESLSFGELQHHCEALPFLYDRRLVMVDGLLHHLFGRSRKGRWGGAAAVPATNKKYLQDLVDYLPTLPPTTRLFFLEPDILPAKHPVLKLARSLAGTQQAVVRDFPEIKERDLVPWIKQRARQKESAIDHQAAELMAAFVGSKPRLLDNELEKLLLYTDRTRPISAEDVRLLVSQVREADIFDLVDSIGQREADRALRLLHRMLDDEEHPLMLLAMITRQFRLLLQVKDLEQRGMAEPAIKRKLKLHPYVASKIARQARNFTLAQLDASFDRLVEADWAIKTGRASEALSLDLLVVDLTRLGI